MKRILLLIALLLSASAARANCVVGATGAVGGGTCSQAGDILIASLTASSSASLSFSGANFVNTYPRLELICSGLTPSGTSPKVYVDIGTGGTPTWQQANYTLAGQYGTASTAPAQFGGTTQVDLLGSIGVDTGAALSFTMIINNPGSTTVNKMVIYDEAHIGSSVLQITLGRSFWSGSGSATTPLTGIQVIPGTTGPGVGGLTLTSGNCGLYGKP